MGASQPQEETNPASRSKSEQPPDPDLPETSAEIRIGKELVLATRPFARESVAEFTLEEEVSAKLVAAAAGAVSPRRAGHGAGIYHLSRFHARCDSA